MTPDQAKVIAALDDFAGSLTLTGLAPAIPDPTRREQAVDELLDDGLVEPEPDPMLTAVRLSSAGQLVAPAVPRFWHAVYEGR